MLPGIRAKFHCNYVNSFQGVEIIHAHPVYGEENKIWSEATPCGQLSVTISNPAAQGIIKEGTEFYLDFIVIEK